MKKIAVSTDTNCSLTVDEANKLGVYLLPMPINIDGKEYFENETISYDEFMTKLKNGSKVFTSQPSAEALCALWDEALKQAEYVIHVPMDSVLSGSYQTAVMLSKEYSGRVKVVDVRRVSLPSLQAIYDILYLIDKDYDVDDIVEIINNNSDNYSCYVVLDELEHLKKGGRINATTAIIGEILSVKPIIEFVNGALKTNSKTHGILKGEKKIIELIKNDLNNKFAGKKVNFHIAYSCSQQEATKFKNRVCAELQLSDIVMAQLPASLACHIGAGSRGLSVEEVVG